MTEAQLQKAVAAYLDRALPANAVWFHVPNSIRTSHKQAATHKAFGMKAGVADCIIVHAGRPIAIELKTPKGRVSTAQGLWADAWRAAGGTCRLCRSLEDVESALRWFGVPLHASVMAGGGIQPRATAGSARRVA